MGWEDRDWARPDPADSGSDPSSSQSSFARRRSRRTRAFAIGMLLLLGLVALAGIAHL